MSDRALINVIISCILAVQVCVALLAVTMNGRVDGLKADLAKQSAKVNYLMHKDDPDDAAGMP